MKEEQRQREMEMEMQVEKMELETGQSGEEALTTMLTQIYHSMWQGSTEATIKAMISQAEVHEIPSILQFAEKIPELPVIPEWPTAMPPTSDQESGGSAGG